MPDSRMDLGPDGAPAPRSSGVSQALSAEELDRYSRQVIVPGMGRNAQLLLRDSHVLIIGAGGLGCPAAQYLAGAGVGLIGIVDGDVVEASNLHRQVGHTTDRVGMMKVDSLITHLKGINPLIEYEGHPTPLTPQNAAKIMHKYDLILDCTDNPATRYLISDVCVLLQKPLISAAAVRKTGHLIILNCPPAPQGWIDKEYPPCYRCCFSKASPSPETCGEAGILGPVVGMMGVAQAGEAIKILVSGRTHPYPFFPEHITAPGPKENLVNPFLVLYSYDLDSGPGELTFRTAKMTSRRKTCFACGENSKQNITLEGIESGTPNYDHFCNIPTANVTLPEEDRITAKAYYDLPTPMKGVVIDTREKEHFSFGSIPGAVNVPFSKLLRAAREFKRRDKHRDSSAPTVADKLATLLPQECDEVTGWLFKGLAPMASSAQEDEDGQEMEVDEQEHTPFFVVCRRGLDSQEAVETLKEMGVDRGGKRRIVDIIGGMKAWKDEVDPSFQFL